MEIIVLPDEPLSWNDPHIIQEVTGPLSPARKRNRGAQLSKGEILAFIDDDTRPQPGWLQAALVHFQDSHIGAVGGPSITPTDDPFWAQVSGAVYESWMMSGGERLRYHPTTACDVEDFPSCNLLVRRSAFEAVGGFRTDFWPGEDTEFCLALIQNGFRIRYEPRAMIEHHRRSSLAQHFKQLASYGLHRGYFVKRFPKTSLRFRYFLPSLFVVGTLLLIGNTLAGSLAASWLLVISGVMYVGFAALSFANKPKPLQIGAVCVIFCSHVTYGIAFLGGLIAQRLPEEKRDISSLPEIQILETRNQKPET